MKQILPLQWLKVVLISCLIIAGLLAGCSPASEQAAIPTPLSATADLNLMEEDRADDDHMDDDHMDDDDHADDHGHDDGDHGHDDEDEMLYLPELAPVALAAGKKLRVVVTNSIIGDVVAQVSGEAIDLMTLMEAGVDPHSYAPSASALTAVADAHLVFINGWDLEEGLLRDLENVIQGDAYLVAVSAGVEPLKIGSWSQLDNDHVEDHDHGPVDPHTWFEVQNVMQWVDNIVYTLSELDPANAALYEANGQVYKAELATLDVYIREQAALIPVTNRKLITNHDTLGYFARAYGFEVIGTIIPGASTVAEPSARDLAELIEEMRHEEVCTIFVESIANERLATVISAELAGDCAAVQVLSLYTDALGLDGSGAESYLGLMRHNVDTIREGLR